MIFAGKHGLWCSSNLLGPPAENLRAHKLCGRGRNLLVH